MTIAKSVPVTLVVPCFNEKDGMEQLFDRLRALEDGSRGRYDWRFTFVDDGSTDGTAAALEAVCFAWHGASVLRHERNLGVTAAILTGLRHADTEIVCSIDSDCTYDPRLLESMIPLLTEDVALVTASPYHPEGRVLNVPAWRLALSRSASWLYRLMATQRLYTYTSCCRIYRQSVVLALPAIRDGFPGVAELLLRVQQRGGNVVEYPATLRVRRFGQSKLRLMRCITGHLQVMATLARDRLRGSPAGCSEIGGMPEVAAVPAAVEHQAWHRERIVA